MEDLKHYQKNGVTVESQVTVESENYISTGMVTYVEGDIIEIELSHWDSYKLGEVVKLTFYSSKGFLSFYSSIIARDKGVIMVLNPPENQRLSQRRQHTRIDVNASGTLFSLQWNKNGVNKLPHPIVADIRNISLGGLGFSITDDPGIKKKMIAEIELHFDNPLRCLIQISRTETIEDGIFVGAEFFEIDPTHLTTLRGIILRNQLTRRAIEREIGPSID